MTEKKALKIPEVEDSFVAENFKTSTTDGFAILRKAQENPAAKNAAEALASQIEHRVHTLRSLRKVLGLTQVQIASQLGMDQGEISRIEHRKNLHLATLSRFIEATGGRLRITAVYDKTEVELSLNELIEVAPQAE